MHKPIQTEIERADRRAHKLHVHPIDLESQNEELRRTQSDLAAAWNRSMDLRPPMLDDLALELSLPSVPQGRSEPYLSGAASP
jgi:hypothetical protein